MANCLVCEVPLDVANAPPDGPSVYAARVLTGQGMVVVCSAKCAGDPKFSLATDIYAPARTGRTRHQRGVGKIPELAAPYGKKP